YEENDLDLDLFIREIIHADIDRLLSVSSPNTYAALRSKNEGGETESLIADACKPPQQAADTTTDIHDTPAQAQTPEVEDHPTAPLTASIQNK
ncbi:hypothetical protein FRB95_013820, partial [Tulasnella sp. JGI-2019a]